LQPRPHRPHLNRYVAHDDDDRCDSLDAFSGPAPAAPAGRVPHRPESGPARGRFRPRDPSGVGFTYDSRFAVEAWVTRFRKDFGADPRITFFEIPMIAGLAHLGKWFIDGGMRRGTPRQDQENVITVYGGADPWKRRLDFQAPDAAYLLLLDQRGIVRWRHSGSFDEPAYRSLSLLLPALLDHQP
jgi:hypothetical protein